MEQPSEQEKQEAMSTIERLAAKLGGSVMKIRSDDPTLTDREKAMLSHIDFLNHAGGSLYAMYTSTKIKMWASFAANVVMLVLFWFK